MTIKFSQGLRYRMLGIKYEMITNGSFTTDTTGWTATSATLSSVAGGQSGNSLQVSNSSTVNGKAYQDVPTITGQIYELSLYAKRGTAATIAFYIGTTGSESSIYTSGNLTVTAWTNYKYVFKATASTTRITMAVTTTVAANTGLFDEISLTQVSGSLKDIMAECLIAVYASASAHPIQPTTPESAITDTQLLLLSNNMTGNPIVWSDTLNNGYLEKSNSITVASAAMATDTAKYFRIYRYGDSPTSASTDLPRIDGTVSNLTDNPLGDLQLLTKEIDTQSVSLDVVRLSIPTNCPLV